MLPWSSMANTWGKKGLRIFNWPTDVAFPGEEILEEAVSTSKEKEKGSKKKQQGIKAMSREHLWMLEAAFRRVDTSPVFVINEKTATGEFLYYDIICSCNTDEFYTSRSGRETSIHYRGCAASSFTGQGHQSDVLA